MTRIKAIGSKLLPVAILAAIVGAAAFVVFRNGTITTSRSPTNGAVTLAEGMLENVALGELQIAGIVAEETPLQCDVVGSAGASFYTVDSPNSLYALIITASRKKGATEALVNGFCFEWKYEMKQPAIIPGQEPIDFDSLTIEQIKRFQDDGTIPTGGTMFVGP